MIHTTQTWKIGDCLKLMQKYPDNHFDLIIADPPYNIDKAEWDNIPDYLNWSISWISECQRVMKDNGSMYIFHSEIPFLTRLMTRVDDETDLIFKQFITWNKRFKGSKNKGFLDGFVEVGGLRNYQQMAEYILYYTFQDETGLSKTMGSCVYPVREYIRSEIIRAKGEIVLKEVNVVLGTATNGGGVASACLSLDKTVPAMITEPHYLKLREWLNCTTEYEYLRHEYEYLRYTFNNQRYTFNNQKSHHAVWEYDIEKRNGHDTPKPVELVKNILLHSSNEGDNVLDPFIGSGTILDACRQTNRNCIGFDISDEWEKYYPDRAMSHTPTLQSYF